MVGSPCNGSSGSRQASAWPRMARASASLAAPMANRTDSAQRASRSGRGHGARGLTGGPPGLMITSVRLSWIAAYRRIGNSSRPWEPRWEPRG